MVGQWLPPSVRDLQLALRQWEAVAQTQVLLLRLLALVLILTKNGSSFITKRHLGKFQFGPVFDKMPNSNVECFAFIEASWNKQAVHTELS